MKLTKDMKKTCMTAVIALCAAATATAQFVTEGNQQTYSLQQLTATAGSGVELTDGKYCLTGDLTIAATDTLNLAEGETLLFGDEVVLTVNGVARFAATEMATIGAIEGATPEGIMVTGDHASAEFAHLDVSAVNIRYAATTHPLKMRDCAFHDCVPALNGNSGVLQLITTVAGNVIENCTFTSNATPAIGSAANYPLALTVRGCTFEDNNMANANNPQINLAVGGEHDVLIVDNVITGAGRTMVGGIGLSNFMGYDGAGRVVVENNTITENRYGIANVGPVPQFIIKGNTLINNHHETNAMNGGSGISLYDPYAMTHARIEGNHIEGSLWGITVIGCAEVNAGKTEVPTSDADYNLGGNVFKDNGNGGVLYDLYNNSTLTVYAQGNTWNVPVQDAEHIEDVVFHKADNASLGEVIYMPAAEGAGLAPLPHSAAALRYDAASHCVTGMTGDVITVTDMAAVTVATAREQVDVTALPTGIYVARSARGMVKFVKQ